MAAMALLSSGRAGRAAGVGAATASPGAGQGTGADPEAASVFLPRGMAFVLRGGASAGFFGMECLCVEHRSKGGDCRRNGEGVTPLKQKPSPCELGVG